VPGKGGEGGIGRSPSSRRFFVAVVVLDPPAEEVAEKEKGRGADNKNGTTFLSLLPFLSPVIKI